MSSPIHKYLFSPPPSPPSLPAGSQLRSPALTSLQSLLPLDLLPRRSIEGSGLKTRSPRTPQQSRFSLDAPYPSRSKANTFVLTVDESPATAPTTPRLSEKSLEAGQSSQYLNVPTAASHAATSISLSLPRPVLRLLFLAALMITSISMLVFVPAARLPSLRAASASRRLALSEDGRAYVDVANPIASWEEAKDREYVPPQIFANRLSPRGVDPKPAPMVKRTPVAPPKATRPSARPLPRTHELLALQSYLLQSSYNMLPADINTAEPLDANLVLGYEADDATLVELEAERAKDVVVWYGAHGESAHPHELLEALKDIHGASRHPTLVPLHSRPDRERLLAVLERLEMPIDSGAVIMIGNRPYACDESDIKEMKSSGRLAQLLASIGWNQETKMQMRKGWKPKLARLAKKQKTEVEHALEQARRK